MKYDRILCFGDSITLGANDSEGLGWPGRLARSLNEGGHTIAVYNLGVNGDTSSDIAVRWQAEALARGRNQNGLLLFAFGFNDASKQDQGNFQVDLKSSLETARKLISDAKLFSDVLWIGPTPLDESVNPLQTDYASWETSNADIARYDAAYAGLAQEIEIDYLSMFSECLHSPRYQAALIAGDKVHPGNDGYTFIAERITDWQAWKRLILRSDKVVFPGAS